VSVADPVMLATARQARGLTQAELAREAGLSQAFISKAEAGQVELDGERLNRTAEVLRYPVSLLSLTAEVHSLVSTCGFHRKRTSLPVNKIKQVHASLDLARVQAEELLHDVSEPDVRLRRIPLSSDGEVSPRDIARQVRAALGLAKGPIQDLTAAVEDAGVVVLSWDLGHRQGDAVSQWLEGHRPIVLIYSAAPGDRQRFSLAHELGHAVMHIEPVERQEEQADQFASELLMPGQVIRTELSNLDMPALARLKGRWGVSMAALIRRARDLGAINDYRYKELNIELSKAGWRSREPVEIPPEQPRLLADVVARLREKGLDDQAIAERGRIDVRDLGILLNEQGAA
jgi:Zn-dependent peptidase ImmA (M78 family)/DNA-binding XRE family transcriptional regulator